MPIILEGYDDFLRCLKQQIRQAQLRAVFSVNRDLVLLYWQIGRDILQRQQAQGWGAKVVDQLAADLHKSFPEMQGLSLRNLKYMRAFAEAWPDEAIVQQLVAQIPWGHNVRILDYVKNPAEREWYLRATLEHGWSRLSSSIRSNPASTAGRGRRPQTFKRPCRRPNPISPSRSSWIGIWSPHPAVSNLLCIAFRRLHRLHELVTGAESISLDRQSRTEDPFLIILDTLPLTLEGSAASVRRARTSFPRSKLVGLVDFRRGDTIQLLCLGLSGMVQASTNLDADLASAITTIHRGSIWVPECVLIEHARRMQSLIDGHLAPHTVLSAREAQVLDSVTWGRSNKEIARTLVITERTVKFHVSNILSKLGLERRTELVRWHEPI